MMTIYTILLTQATPSISIFDQESEETPTNYNEPHWLHNKVQQKYSLPTFKKGVNCEKPRLRTTLHFKKALMLEHLWSVSWLVGRARRERGPYGARPQRQARKALSLQGRTERRVDEAPGAGRRIWIGWRRQPRMSKQTATRARARWRLNDEAGNRRRG